VKIKRKAEKITTTEIENGLELIEDALNDAITTACIFELEGECEVYEKAQRVVKAIREAVPDAEITDETIKGWINSTTNKPRYIISQINAQALNVAMRSSLILNQIVSKKKEAA